MIQILSLTALDAKLSQRLMEQENIDSIYDLLVIPFFFVCLYMAREGI